MRVLLFWQFGHMSVEHRSAEIPHFMMRVWPSGLRRQSQDESRPESTGGDARSFLRSGILMDYVRVRSIRTTRNSSSARFSFGRPSHNCDEFTVRFIGTAILLL